MTWPPLLALVALPEGRFGDALARAAGMPEDTERLFYQSLAWNGLGRRADSDAALAALIQASGRTHPVRIAEVYAYRGETEQAFQWLSAGKAGDYEDPAVRYSPFLRPLRQDPRWGEWLEHGRRKGS